ncbi:MAG: chromosome partitioning ATPase [Burkholderiaceae bacterium]|jgi:exopolysaccharide/PEP-CTERM locus tyrosine autokinase|nr:chromosome partitioning ATPase [Burkholderiales bacterium]MCZ8108151.1 chromosome partitioning ATPase [Burkholderiales bacterium]MCZ8337312.1 chromosome partitioning ATPase [Burkholderiaceae bacterium]
MSLIERAIGKLGETPGKLAPTPERAMDAIRDRAPGVEPATAAPGRSLPLGSGPVGAEPARMRERQPTVEPGSAPALRLDVASLVTRGFVSPEGLRSPVAQDFRVIKRPLLANAFGRGTAALPNGRCVMVSSAFPDEGKTFSAVNLALSVATERDTEVVLVDADVARPSLPEVLGVPPVPGLMDGLLDSSIDLDALVRPTSIDRLSLMLSGRGHDAATELLASDAMVQMIARLMARFPQALIVFDSPPLLLTTESRVLATHMGQIVLVVEAGRTPREAVKEALSTVEGCGFVGMVLNKSAGSKQGYGYGYGGQHGYGDRG